MQFSSKLVGHYSVTMKIFTTDVQDKYQEHSSSLIKKAVGGWTCSGSSDCNGRCVGRSY